MRLSTLRRCALGAAGCVALGLACGCYEQNSQSEAAPASAQAPEGPADPGGTSSGTGARSSYGKARGAAERTVERSDEHQREIEKALEDPD